MCVCVCVCECVRVCVRMRACVYTGIGATAMLLTVANHIPSGEKAIWSIVVRVRALSAGRLT